MHKHYCPYCKKTFTCQKVTHCRDLHVSVCSSCFEITEFYCVTCRNSFIYQSREAAEQRAKSHVEEFPGHRFGVQPYTEANHEYD